MYFLKSAITEYDMMLIWVKDFGQNIFDIITKESVL